MRAAGSLGLAALLISAILLGIDLRLQHRHHLAVDERPGAYQAPMRVMARIQSDLERLAADRPRAALPRGADRDGLERLVDGLDALLGGRRLEAVDHLAIVRAEAVRRLGLDGTDLAARLRPIPDKPWIDFARTMRLADAALLAEQAEAWGRRADYDLVARKSRQPRARGDRLLDDAGLMVPCRLDARFGKELAAAKADLNDLAGTLLSCPPTDPPPPVPAPVFTTRPPAPPWDRDAAIRHMADNADAAEAVLRLAMLEGGAVAKLDFALFLAAFHEPGTARDEEIRALMAAVDRASLAAGATGQPAAFDGTDASLLPSLRLAVASHVADIASGRTFYPYAVPCAVAQRHPALVGDGAISGCLIGRGRLDGFPEAELAAFVLASAKADGGDYALRAKMPRWPLASGSLDLVAAIQTAPARLLALPAPTMDLPYRTWSYATLGNRATAGRIQSLAVAAYQALVPSFVARGLDQAQAEAAAGRALFALALGSSCGEGMPPPSLRRLVMDKAPIEEIQAILNQPVVPESLQPFTDCARFAPFDPLSHVAAAYPAVLETLWTAAAQASPEADPEGLRSMRQVNGRNHFGKTPLMAAAEAGELDAVRFWLSKGAEVNADSWQSQKRPTLAHDSRTALIYAAANAPLPVIKALVAAGADIMMADTKGWRAVHYLAANANLSPEDRAKAAKLLY
jgi:hypothetical protein